MKKILLIYRVDKSDASNIGVIKKQIGQRNGLVELGYSVDTIIHDQQHIYLNEQKIFSFKNKVGNLEKWNYFKFLLSYSLSSYDVYLIRYPLATPAFIKFLLEIRKNKSAKLIIDMPTFPFIKEWKGIKRIFVQMIEGYYGKRLSKYVDYMLHSGDEKIIYGIPTIKCSNGIDVKSIKLRKPVSDENCHLLAIGKWQFWHGLDRMIQGLYEYQDYRRQKVILHIVGDGPEINGLKEQALRLGLKDVIIFYGVLRDQKLESLFDLASLGIGTLGLHRKGVRLDSSLKHREYISRGLPFVTASEDTDLNNEHFVLGVPSDESPINVRSILEFLISQQVNDNHHLLRSYAEEHLSWRVKMRSIMQYLHS